MFEKMPVGVSLSILHRSFKRRMDEKLKDTELTGVQFGVLAQIHRFEMQGMQEINQKMLEKHIRVTHPTMTEIIKKLEKKGLISCETSILDRRQKRISTTEKAHQLHLKVDRVENEVFNLLCEGLSAEQRQQFIEITDIMLANVFKDYPKGDENCGD